MKPKDTLIINLNVDWRVLVVLGVAAGMVVLAYSAVGAQSGNPPNTNSVQVEPTANLPEPPPVTLPDPLASQGDGFLLTTNGERVPADTVGTAPSSASVTGVTSLGAGSRHFYLTNANYYTDQARTACASGYHMASLWEILDVSNLTYDYTHPAAYNQDDSGYGPPSYWNGWVRTGQDSSGSSTTGTGNCLNWTSRNIANYGVTVRLSRTWETAPGDIFAWDATSFTCNFTGPVWCVGN